MTQHFTPSGERALDQELAVLRQTLTAITEDLQRLHAVMQNDGFEEVAGAGRLLAEVRQCTRLALLMERDFDERNASNTGGEQHSSLDLNAARSAIRCRLDRLRTCRGAD